MNPYKTAESKLIASLQLKADMFDYLCWLEKATQPEEAKDEFLCIASDGTTCWGSSYADAVRVAMEHDKAMQDTAELLHAVKKDIKP